MISLITATLGRFDEFDVLLKTLDQQTYKDFELIVVDQNASGDLKKIIDRHASLNIVYIKSERKGLSFNRNIGISKASGSIIGFPDDDCYYDSSVLEAVIKTFSKNPECKLVAVNAKDTISDKVFLEYSGTMITRSQLLKKCISYNFFIKRQEGMRFDEQLGVGAEFGSGEETDFLWEYYAKGDRGLFCTNVYVHHPHNQSPVNISRAYNYGKGMGAIFKKEVCYRRHYLMFFNYLKMIARPLAALIIKPEKSFYFNTLRGRIKGFCSY